MDRVSKTSLVFLGTFLLIITVSFILSFLVPDIAGNMPVYADILLTQSLIAFPAFMYLKKTGRNVRTVAKKGNFGLVSVLILFALAFFCIPVAAVMNVLSSALFGNAVSPVMERTAALPRFWNILFFAVLPAIVEEYVFRGFYYHEFRHLGFFRAMLACALFFGIMHMNLNQFSYGFVLGMIFCFVLEATGSIYAPMLIHFGINFTSVNLSDLLLSGNETAGMETAAGMDAQYMQLEAALMSPGGIEASTILLYTVLAVAAVISLGICILLIWLLAKVNNRDGYISWIINGGEKKSLERYGKAKLLTPAFMAAVLTGFGIMILTHFL